MSSAVVGEYFRAIGQSRHDTIPDSGIECQRMNQHHTLRVRVRRVVNRIGNGAAIRGLERLHGGIMPCPKRIGKVDRRRTRAKARDYIWCQDISNVVAGL
jgi:hypothetical protein